MGTLRFVSELALFAAALGFAALSFGRRTNAARAAGFAAAAIAAGAFVSGSGFGEHLAGVLLGIGIAGLLAPLPWSDRAVRPPVVAASIALIPFSESSLVTSVVHLAAAAAFAVAIARAARRSTATSLAASTASPVGAGAIAAASLLTLATVTSVVFTPASPVDQAAPPPPEPRAQLVERAAPATPPRDVPPRAPHAAKTSDPRPPTREEDPPASEPCTLEQKQVAEGCLVDVEIRPTPLPRLAVEVPLLDTTVTVDPGATLSGVVGTVTGAIGGLL